jgi:hypothetical protein
MVGVCGLIQDFCHLSFFDRVALFSITWLGKCMEKICTLVTEMALPDFVVTVSEMNR